MKNCRSWPVIRISLPIVTLALVFTTATRVHSAPSEEDISGSSSLRTPPPRSAATGGGWSEGDFRATDQAGQGSTGDEGAPGHAAVSSPLSAPRAVFPYTVRSGDTPGGIAALFGVPVADLLRLNHLHDASSLMIGDTLRIPNPFLARERELSSELEHLSAEKRGFEERAEKNGQEIANLRSTVQELSASNNQYKHDLRTLPWWRGTARLASAAAALMLALMLAALVQWIIARARFRAVAEMNESLRRLDYKYKAALAKAELRFQELYGRRRRSIPEGQEQAKTPDEVEIEQLNRQLRDLLQRHLQRLERSSSTTGRARWRERLGDVAAPMEVRSVRR